MSSSVNSSLPHENITSVRPDRRRVWFARGARLALLVAAAMLVRLAQAPPENHLEGTIPWAEIVAQFPSADHLSDQDAPRGGAAVRDTNGRSLGYFVLTSPATDDLIGYAGPSNLLIFLDLQQRVTSVAILTSGDTAAHVQATREANGFWESFRGWSPATEPAPPVEAVSGSTLTSLAMAEAVERRLQGTVPSLRFPEPVTIPEVRAFFPTVKSLTADARRTGWFRVDGVDDEVFGYVVRTSPHSDNGRGYRGPTEVLIAVDPTGQRVTGVRLRKSYDTPDYVDRVRDDAAYLASLTQYSIDQWSTLDLQRAGIEGVSGATQTSFAVADSLQRRFAADRAKDKENSEGTSTTPRGWRRASTPALLVILLGALALTFTSWRSKRRLRLAWQIAIMLAFGLWIGDLLSLALFAGWSRQGLPWRDSPAVIAMLAVALLVPWATGHQIYCQQICPHGMAQEWICRWSRIRWRLPAAWHRWLERVPAATLVTALALATFFPTFDLARLEPFDAWVLWTAAWGSAAIALLGLIASAFIPQAYCRYGCPTGELLQLIKSGGSFDRFRRRDALAAGILAIGFLGLCVVRATSSHERTRFVRPPQQEGGSNPSVFDGQAKPDLLPNAPWIWRGRAFGATWSVRFRDEAPAETIRSRVIAEINRIEHQLSHWHPDSFTAQFNAAETTLAMEQPAELIMLVQKARDIGQATDGDYDLTVARLVDAWGFGPSRRTEPPTESEIATLRESIGWDKLEIDPAEGTLRKQHPALAIDLGSLLHGYAADRVTQLLDEVQAGPFLVEVGGELYARGKWSVAIESPAAPDQLAQAHRLQIEDQALATSGVYRMASSSSRDGPHHLLSPKTGRPQLVDTPQCAVLARSALEADAWATALLAVGRERAKKLASAHSIQIVVPADE